MNLTNFLETTIKEKYSDIFIVAGHSLSYTANGKMSSVGDRLNPSDTKDIITQLYTLANRDISRFLIKHDDDFSFSISNLGRFRVNTYMQRGSFAAVLRVVVFNIPNYDELHILPEIINIANINKGLVLVTGPAGSGKSTTLACIIDKINKTREGHIITIEDPVEFLHKHNKCIVSQREIHIDTDSYQSGLRAALRESPNVIQVGEMRDLETISIGMSAAETGQLVLSTLHTLGAANTIDRIIDVFPPNQQHQVRIQLSMVLKAVISQQLIPTVDGKLVPAFEIMFCNSAIRNMIRDSKVYQIDSAIYSYGTQGMLSMDASISQLYNSGIISKESAMTYCMNKELIEKRMNTF